MIKQLLILTITISAAIAGYSQGKSGNIQDVSGYTQEKKWNIAGGGGFAMPINLAKEFCNAGSNAFANATYNVSQSFSAGCEVNYTYLTSKTIAENKNVNTDFFALMAKGVYTYKKPYLSPYFALNFGWYKAQEDPGEFGYSGEVGVLYSRINLGVGYHIATSRGFEYLQINIGYRFSF